VALRNGPYRSGSLSLCVALWADAKSDFDSAKRDYDSVKSKYDDQKSRVESYLEQSRGLRSFDATRLNTLIDMLCKQDSEPNDRDVDDLVQGLISTAVDNVKRNYDDTMRVAYDRIGGNERILDQAKGVRNRAKDLQSSYSCDEREVVLSSGRPDCVKFAQDDCQILEFKPDTYSTSAAESQARTYLEDVRRKFKDDDRAKKCKQVDGYPFFRTIGVTYTACRS